MNGPKFSEPSFEEAKGLDALQVAVANIGDLLTVEEKAELAGLFGKAEHRYALWSGSR